MSTKAGKRPLRSLTAHEKLDAIRRVHDGESKASVARDIGVPESTLRGWCKNEDKISYLSRQSSPETDESLEHKDKRQKVEENVMQPFNLSLKTTSATTNAYSPNSEQRYTIDGFMKNEHDVSKCTKPETPKSTTSHMSERERNRAELARLSVELGLNRPEMFLPSLNTTSNTLADLTANIGLLAQWNSLLLQQQQQKAQQINKKITAPADTSTNLVSSSGGGGNGGGLLTTVDNDKLHNNAIKPPKEKQSVNDYVSYWLKTQQALFGLSQTGTPTSTIQNANNNNGLTTTTASTLSTKLTTNNSTTLNGVTADHSSWFWKWYKQFAYNQHQQPVADKPILYQQLTKDQQNAENLSTTSDDKPKNNTNNKARSVLDNLLLNNNNNVAVNNKKDGKEDDVETVSQSEALEHGEKFLKWLEACSDPSVTAMQIMQFRSLLNNVKSGADRKNGDIQNKTKVKRK